MSEDETLLISEADNEHVVTTSRKFFEPKRSTSSMLRGQAKAVNVGCASSQPGNIFHGSQLDDGCIVSFGSYINLGHQCSTQMEMNWD